MYFDQTDGLFRDIECKGGGNSSSSGSGGSGGAPAACHNTNVDSEMSIQTAQSLPLFLGLPTDSAADRKRAGDALAHDVANGTFPGRTTAGMVGTKYVLSALVEAGHAEVALDVATAMEYPSWGKCGNSVSFPSPFLTSVCWWGLLCIRVFSLITYHTQTGRMLRVP